MRKLENDKHDISAFNRIEFDLEGIMDGLDVLNLLAIHPDLDRQERNAMAFAAEGIKSHLGKVVAKLAGKEACELFFAGR